MIQGCSRLSCEIKKKQDDVTKNNSEKKIKYATVIYKTKKKNRLHTITSSSLHQLSQFKNRTKKKTRKNTNQHQKEKKREIR